MRRILSALPGVAALLGAGLGIAAPAAAQAGPVPDLRLGTGASFESYEFLDPDAVGVRNMSLVTVPFAVRVRPLERLQLQVGGAYARGALRRTDDSEATLAGPTDTEIRASYVFGRDLVVVSAAYIAPTGQATHTLDEAEVAGTFASQLIPTRVSQWGSGGGFSVGTTVAVPAGDFGLGFGIGYTVASEFDVLDIPNENWAYRPGNELRLQLGVDRTFGPAGKAALLFNLQRYDDDRLAGENLLQPGSRFDLTGLYSFAAGAGANGVVYLGVAHRDAGTLLVPAGELPAHDLVFAGAGLRLPLAGAVFVPAVEGRVLRRGDGLNQGHLGGAGFSLEWPVGGLTVVPTLRSRFGKLLLWQDEEASFRGGEIGLTIRMGANRL
jgi:hypothetical protein